MGGSSLTQPKQPINVETGEFPYPLTDGPDESRYLTWVRNHSNYMAERGFLDYFRIAAVLVRGIVINFLTLLPYLLVVSLLLGLAYNTLLDDWDAQVRSSASVDLFGVEQDETDSPSAFFVFKEVSEPGWAKSFQDGLPAPTPFLLTPMVLALAAFWVLSSPIVTRLYKVVRHNKAVRTGRSSSVKTRDLFERLFGALLVATFAAILIDAFPLLMHFFHQIRGGDVGWTFPTVASAVGILVAAKKFLPLLGGLTRKLAMIVVGALGLLLPLLVILFVVEFLVYAPSRLEFLDGLLLLIPVLMVVGVLVAIALGIRALDWKGFLKLCLLLVELGGLIVAVIVLYWLSLEGVYKNFYFVLAWAVVIWIFCRLTVDVNLTSIHGLYRDRLASAYLVGVDSKGDVDIEEDIDLQEIGRYEAGSTAPYHLINVALNLQGSKDIAIRERNSDFFIFSKRFIGSERTGYCRSENMEQVYPQIDLGTAMAISAAAASPNMGRGTNPLMVAFMTLLNVRLGFWIPNPGRLENYLLDKKYVPAEPKQLDFANDVFPNELEEIKRRREQAYLPDEMPPIDDKKENEPTTGHKLVGIGFSGGGIRSATFNLGIAQALHKRGIFDHIDYMSTVSGGGYLGSSISALMRYKTNPFSETAGTVSVETASPDGKLVRITGTKSEDTHEYRYSEYAELDESIVTGAKVKAGQRLLKRETGPRRVSLMESLKWRVRPGALWREMMSMLDETHKWVNLSDGGHIENLAGIELLRRRCKYIIIGDGEADPNLHFNGLATLIRYARIDLGVDVDIDPDGIRVDKSEAAVEKGIDNRSREHWAVGEITYPPDKARGYEKETGYLLYLKSSFSGDEGEVIKEYRHRHPDFPHQSTADQFFDENQFEAYRALGQHIGEQALPATPGPSGGKLKFDEMESWFAALREKAKTDKQSAAKPE